MKNSPDNNSQNARKRLDKQDAFRKLRSLIRRIGDRAPTLDELIRIEELRKIINEK